MMTRTLTLAGVMSAGVVTILLSLPSATPHPAATPSHKGDRLRREPAPWLPDAAWGAPIPQPTPKAAPEPALPVLEPIPKPPEKTAVHQPDNICTRHRGWKVMTDNGRSWHCAFAR